MSNCVTAENEEFALANAEILRYTYKGVEERIAFRAALGAAFVISDIYGGNTWKLGEDRIVGHLRAGTYGNLDVVRRFPDPLLAELVGTHTAFRFTDQHSIERLALLVTLVSNGERFWQITGSVKLHAGVQSIQDLYKPQFSKDVTVIDGGVNRKVYP